jgi:serine/threonine-protein kinase RsbW
MDEPIHLELSLDLPKDAALVARTRRTLDGALAGAGVDENCRHAIQMALGEACANVIQHAQLAAMYRVDVCVRGDQCVIEVIDDGGGFDPVTVEPADPLDERGRGLAVMAGVVDGLELISVSSTGTLLRFTKQLTWTNSTRVGGAGDTRATP